jgi:hypothetical protein
MRIVNAMQGTAAAVSSARFGAAWYGTAFAFIAQWLHVHA